MLATIKTHKEPVSARLIHSYVASVCKTLSAAIDGILVPELGTLSWLCWSTEDATRQLRRSPIDNRCILLKFGAVDFDLGADRKTRLRSSLRLYVCLGGGDATNANLW